LNKSASEPNAEITKIVAMSNAGSTRLISEISGDDVGVQVVGGVGFAVGLSVGGVGDLLGQIVGDRVGTEGDFVGEPEGHPRLEQAPLAHWGMLHVTQANDAGQVPPPALQSFAVVCEHAWYVGKRVTVLQRG
jgi:hypothetical protein